MAAVECRPHYLAKLPLTAGHACHTLRRVIRSLRRPVLLWAVACLALKTLVPPSATMLCISTTGDVAVVMGVEMDNVTPADTPEDHDQPSVPAWAMGGGEPTVAKEIPLTGDTDELRAPVGVIVVGALPANTPCLAREHDAERLALIGAILPQRHIGAAPSLTLRI